MMKFKNIVVVNDKGGSSKSTTSFQVVGAYFLNKKENVCVYEFDDENKDSRNFTETVIQTKQVKMDDGTDINSIVRDAILSEDDAHKVFDVGGNRTTTLFLDALKASRMFKKIDLYIIPMSGGSQDLENAKKIYSMIKEFDVNAKIIFSLSRIRNNSPKRIRFQYRKFFENKIFGKSPFFTLKDSDVIDLSRDMKISAFELAKSESQKKAFETALDDAIDRNSTAEISEISTMLEVYDESENFLQTSLLPAFSIIEENL